ncbi:hypothetical protein Pcac1_g18762 [Phytophthora cactorum]|nr:hypothetical protein Pcac1_g18762 [Phytophthora cactorum]
MRLRLLAHKRRCRRRPPPGLRSLRSQSMLNTRMVCEDDPAFVDRDDELDAEHSLRQTMINHARSCLQTRDTDW